VISIPAAPQIPTRHGAPVRDSRDATTRRDATTTPIASRVDACATRRATRRATRHRRDRMMILISMTTTDTLSTTRARAGGTTSTIADVGSRRTMDGAR
jgi:hypothetical protein